MVKSTNLQNMPLKEEVEVEEVEDKHEFLFTHVCEYWNLIIVLVKPLKLMQDQFVDTI